VNENSAIELHTLFEALMAHLKLDGRPSWQYEAWVRLRLVREDA
jgi:hypothetical protein